MAWRKQNVTQHNLCQAVRNYLKDVNARTLRLFTREGIPERIISFLKTTQTRRLHYDERPEIGGHPSKLLKAALIPADLEIKPFFSNFFFASEKERFS